jgi:hypothetical protein
MLKKRLKHFLVTCLIICLAIFVYVCIDQRNYYEVGESDSFEIHIGESFTVKISENGSLGTGNCWINTRECNGVVLNSESYTSSWDEKFGCIGCGGTSEFTFVGIEPGLDTIKIAKFPTGIAQKPCSYFQDSTIDRSGDSTVYIEGRNIAPAYIFTVTVVQ